MVGNAATFGGYNNPADIHIPNSPSLKFTNDATISFAVKITGFDGMDGYGSYAAYGAHAVVAKSHDRSGFIINVAGNDTKQIYSGAGSFEWDKNGIGEVSDNYQVGQWKRFTYIFSNSTRTAKLYADGVLIKTLDTFNQSFDSANQEDLYLGKFSDSWYPLNGSLDEVRIYNRALSESEIQQLYEGKEKVASSIDLSLALTAPTSVKTAEKATYQLTATNNGNAPATGVKAHFVVPRKSIATVDIPKNCTLNGRIIECALSDLGANQSATQTFSMTALRKGALSVVGLVNSDKDDANYDDNKKSAVVSVK